MLQELSSQSSLLGLNLGQLHYDDGDLQGLTNLRDGLDIMGLLVRSHGEGGRLMLWCVGLGTALLCGRRPCCAGQSLGCSTRHTTNESEYGIWFRALGS